MLYSFLSFIGAYLAFKIYLICERSQFPVNRNWNRPLTGTGPQPTCSDP